MKAGTKACMYCGWNGRGLIRSSLFPGKWRCRSKKACEERSAL